MLVFVEGKWYCAVYMLGGVRATSYNLQEVQRVLGGGSSSNIQVKKYQEIMRKNCQKISGFENWNERKVILLDRVASFCDILDF